jgi:hypothetical protein
MNTSLGEDAQKLSAGQPMHFISRHCPGCTARTFFPFFRLEEIPVNCSALWPTQESARSCVRGDIELALCLSCGLIFNQRFDAGLVEYNNSYDNSLDFSPSFQSYSQELSQRLCQTYRLQGKRIISIGCGRGEFLKRLCEDDPNFGVGFDPSFDGELQGTPNLRFVRDYYSEAYASEPVDFLCCRHVLEHIPDPFRFLSTLRRTLVKQGPVTVYFEVPNALSVLAGPSAWDVIYPHVSYFTSDSLCFLFSRAGFDVLQVGTAFSDQFAYVEARVRVNEQPTEERLSSSLQSMADAFRSGFQSTVSQWVRILQTARQNHQRVAFWGAGAKGVTFLNSVPGASQIGMVADANPRKQEMYVPGTAQQIFPPQQLVRYRPDIVITLNPVYVDEIQSTLSSLGLHPELISTPEDLRRPNAARVSA